VKPFIVDTNQKIRRSLLNQLTSLKMAGVQHIPIKGIETEVHFSDAVLHENQKVLSDTDANLKDDNEAVHHKVSERQSATRAGGNNQAEDTIGHPPKAVTAGRNIQIETSWKTRLADPFNASYMTALSEFLRKEKAEGKRIYPPGNEIFRAFELTPFDDVKVVILGQDPYHGPGQAHGLSFSVAAGVQPPPSLRNIYRELEADLGISHPGHGNLEGWARQGVLLLNSCLTVQEGQAGSHQGKGWELFTDEVIRCLNDDRQNLVFILWGRKAQDKGTEIDRSRHCVLSSVHPSPLSASNGFFGSKPFSQANAYLEETGQKPVDWNPG